jgi:hypothetical protein
VENKLWQNEFFRDCLAVQEMTLKVGAQVILVKNVDLTSRRMLVNGSRGVVVDFVYFELKQDSPDVRPSHLSPSILPPY